jgi:hypothetical protein
LGEPAAPKRVARTGARRADLSAVALCAKAEADSAKAGYKNSRNARIACPRWLTAIFSSSDTSPNVLR